MSYFKDDTFQLHGNIKQYLIEKQQHTLYDSL